MLLGVIKIQDEIY